MADANTSTTSTSTVGQVEAEAKSAETGVVAWFKGLTTTQKVVALVVAAVVVLALVNFVL